MQCIANNLDKLLEKWQNIGSKTKISMTHITIKNYSKASENEQQQPQPLVEAEVNVGHGAGKTTNEKNILEKNVKLVFFCFFNCFFVFFKKK